MNVQLSAGSPNLSGGGPNVVLPVDGLKTADSPKTTDPSSKVETMTSTMELKLARVQGNQIHVSDEQLIKAIERAIKAMQGPYTSLEFAVHDKTHELMVKVKDKETGEILREIPPEKTLDFVAKLWEMAGILVDQRA